jgi:putative ABC transport system permease protein
VWSPAGFRCSPFAAPNRGRRFLEGCLARLRPGVAIEQAQAQLDAYGARMHQQFAADYPAGNGWRPLVVPLRADVVGGATAPMVILLAGASLLLLIVCANIAHLVLARTSERAPELAIRQALGASAGRLTRQLLAESGVLAAAGGALGLLLAAWGLQILIALAPSRVPRVGEMAIDGAAMGAAAALSILTALVFGLAASARLGRSTIATSAVMKEGGPGRSAGVQRARLRGGLVSAQVAIATVLLVAAGLLVRTVGELLSVPIGFETGNLTTARIWLPLPNDAASGRYARADRRAAFGREVVARLAAVPGVTGAALSTQVPMGGYSAPPFVEIEVQDAPDRRARPVLHDFQVSPGYFRTLGLPIVRGRAITADDRAGADPVVVISEAAAKTYWSDRNPIGTRVRFGDNRPWMTVVGVAADVRHRRLTEPAQPMMYRPFDQEPNYLVAILIRTSGPVPGLAEAIAKEVRGVDADLPIYSVRTMDELIAGAVAERRFLMRLLAAFGVAAVAIALLGIYGVMAYAVSRRTREIGIRMAIGARREDVSRMVIKQGLVLTASGLVVGLLASLALGRLITSQLFGVQPADPWTLAVVPLVMVAVSLAAAYLPARRAAQVDPMMALRGE